MCSLLHWIDVVGRLRFRDVSILGGAAALVQALLVEKNTEIH